jgi:hypothetical protein
MSVLVFMTIPGLVLLLIVLVAVDRMGTWGSRRLRLPWRKDEAGRAIPAPGLDELDALFYASKRYELDQRQASLMLREEDEDGAPPRGKVDLDRGIAVIRRPGSRPEPPRRPGKDR